MTAKTKAAAKAAPAPTMRPQPLHDVQWVNRDELFANDYNPNHVFRPEMRLLKISILENGWTQPIVARRDGQIVDGFHRWTTSADEEVAALTGGLVPVVYLAADLDEATQRMATIRHNRARGSHHVVKMADIVADLSASGLDNDEIAERLQMEDEEVERLLDRGSKTLRSANPDGFNNGWAPKREA